MKSGQGLVRVFFVREALYRCLGVVRNEQEFSHFDRQMWVKKLVQGIRIRINTWNIGYLTRKLM